MSSDTSGSLLTVEDIDNIAVRVGEMWRTYNEQRRVALDQGEEARKFIFAVDVDTTSANILPHKNRTHQPKLTQLSDTLQSQYFEASLSSADFFRFFGSNPDDNEKARNIEGWVRTKLEQKKFRETTGRMLIADYVNYGNCFASIDYVVEKEGEIVTYKGPVITRISPLDVVFNSRAASFQKSTKMQRELIHVSKLKELPSMFPEAGFKEDTIEKAVTSRSDGYVDDWVEVLKERGLEQDGYGSWDDYFKQDFVEVIIYRGDVFDSKTEETQQNRVLYIVDRIHVIRNEPSKAPVGFDGLHHAGWRVRNDNLWAQGPLANLVGMQYRIDHLENLKADVFDQIAHPITVIKGDDVSEPEEGYQPGAVYYTGVDGDVEFKNPDTTALQADTQIGLYHKMMEDFAGAPPESRGVRTPGEKTAFEVNTLNQGATMMFVDKARNFERMLETLLKEAFELMLTNFDTSDYTQIFDDEEGLAELTKLSLEDVQAHGDFTAMGARHWSRRNRETVELQNFQAGPMQDPKIRMHVDGFALARFWESKLNLKDANIIEEFAGVKEDVAGQAIAQAEQAQLAEQSGLPNPAAETGESAEQETGPPDSGATAVQQPAT